LGGNDAGFLIQLMKQYLDPYASTEIKFGNTILSTVPPPYYDASYSDQYSYYVTAGTYRITPDVQLITGNTVFYHTVNIHGFHNGNGQVILVTPDLNSINLDGTPSGTKGVSSEMKAFVTNT
jgi:hypothetical protein